MSHEQFENEITQLFIQNGGYDIVVFAKHKYDDEECYRNFEIIMSEDDDSNIEIDFDYHEGEDKYLIDGWDYLFDVLDKAHEKGEYRR